MISLDVYTDGAARGNGTNQCVTGWSMVIPNFMGKMYVRYGHLPAPSTNNKAEIAGILYAVHLFKNQQRFKPIIHSDSQYVVKACNEWRYNWAPSYNIKNRKLLVPLFETIDGSPSGVELKWVKGHAGIHGNELADQFANYGRDKVNLDRDDALSNIKYVEVSDIPFDFTPD